MVDHQLLARHFQQADPVMAAVVEQIGPCTLTPCKEYFATLVRSIISQQISTAAAATIRARLESYLKPKKVLPGHLAALTVEELRSLGISRQKAGYLHDLANKCNDGTVQLKQLHQKSDAEIIDELVQVKGIGKWSAQMFLIFALNRPDVFPYDDLGVRNAIQRLYTLQELPTKTVSIEIGRRWQPYSSLGAWYCWRYLEQAGKIPA